MTMTDMAVTGPPEQSGPGARRLLVLDSSDPDHPVWVIAWVPAAAQRPAELDELGQYTDWRETCDWVRAAAGGQPVAMVPVPVVKAWTIGRPVPGQSARIGEIRG